MRKNRVGNDAATNWLWQGESYHIGWRFFVENRAKLGLGNYFLKQGILCLIERRLRIFGGQSI